MLFSKKLIVAFSTLAIPFVNGQARPANTSICDFYTTALLGNLTAENQLTLLTLVVNTVVIGNYTKPNVGIMVPGILAPGMQDGTPVDLLKYFNGSLKTTNRGGNRVSVNFLDDGGAAALMQNKPANTQSSNQYFLLTHLYQIFGTLLGCSQQADGSAFPTYSGNPSQFDVHRFMNLSKPEVDYFITQVGLAAASFGVATADVMAVGQALNTTFGQRCSPPEMIVQGQGSQLQDICINPDCPLATNAMCALYEAAATSTSPSGSAMSTMSAASSGAGGSAIAPSGSAKATGTSAGNALVAFSAGWSLVAVLVAGCFGFALIL